MLTRGWILLYAQLSSFVYFFVMRPCSSRSVVEDGAEVEAVAAMRMVAMMRMRLIEPGKGVELQRMKPLQLGSNVTRDAEPLSNHRVHLHYDLLHRTGK